MASGNCQDILQLIMESFHVEIFPPDLNQELFNNCERGAQAAYPAVGCLRGLAEFRGVMCAIERLLLGERW
jgi:D-mannonate dehydratase